MIDSQSRDLLTCALLNLDPRIVDKRTAINTVLVEAGLLRATEPTSLEEIILQVNRIVQHDGFLQIGEAEDAIRDCTRRKVVIEVDDRYQLSEERRKTLQIAFSNRDQIFEKAKRGLVERIEIEAGEPISGRFADDIFKLVRRVIAEEVYELSLDLARERVTFEQMLLRVDEAPPLARVKALIKDEIPANRELLRTRILGGIVEYVRELPPDLHEMLRLIHHNLLISQILNLDPQMVELQREWFSRRKLYLDTNVVIAHLFEGQKRHDLVHEVIAASLSLDVQLMISPVTLDELTKQIGRAKSNHKLLSSMPLVEVLAMDGDDAVLATYLNLKHEQPALDWEAFISPFESLSETLLEYGILVEDECYDEAAEHTSIEQIRKAVTDAKPFYATEGVIEHDALNTSIVICLRDLHQPDERGQVVWLVSIDQAFRRIQRVLLGSGVIEHPYCLQVEDLGEMVLPAQSLAGFVFDDFIGYLAQARLGAIADPDTINLDFVETIHDAEIDVDRLLRLHPDQVKSAISRLQTSREAREILRGAARATDEPTRTRHQAQFQEMIDIAIEETDPVKQVKTDYERRITLLEKRLSISEEERSALDKQLTVAESSISNRIASWLRSLLEKN